MRDLRRVERDTSRMTAEVEFLGLESADERRDHVEQAGLEVLPEQAPLERQRSGLSVAEEELLLVGQERPGPGVPSQAEDTGGLARDAGGDRRQTPVGCVEGPRLAAALEQAGEGLTGQAEDRPGEPPVAPLAGRDASVAVVQEQHRRTGAKALHREVEKGVHQRRGVAPFQSQLADLEEALHAALAPDQLLDQVG